MRIMMIILGTWLGVGFLAVLMYVFGASVGYRRGYEDGYEVDLATDARELAAGSRASG
jgi:hypothetical protein